MATRTVYSLNETFELSGNAHDGTLLVREKGDIVEAGQWTQAQCELFLQLTGQHNPLFLLALNRGNNLAELRQFILDNSGWRKPTLEESVAIEAEKLAEVYVEREILCVDSSLVEKLMRTTDYEIDGFTPYDIVNYTPEPHCWELQRCIDYLEYKGCELPEREWGQSDEDYLEELRAVISDENDPQDILEWWRVTKWLADHLKEIGEPVLDNDYGYWWGRTTSGQSILCDGVIQKLASRHILMTMK